MFSEATKNRIAAVLLVPFLYGIESVIFEFVIGVPLAIFSLTFKSVFMKIFSFLYDKHHTIWNQSPIMIVAISVAAIISGEILLAAQLITFGLGCLYTMWLSTMIWTHSKITQ